uniref:RING-CH-type domain-containing protein n=1 Tax=Parascaris univalens TaxID=6257 RepID=A0A915A6A8_PARUN
MAAIELTDRSRASVAREGSNEETESDSISLAAKIAERENGDITEMDSQYEAAEESASLSGRARSVPVTLRPNTHNNASTQIKICNTPPTSPTESSSAVEKRACRICQSESGVFVRPCACAGTMGDVHESCLNEWLARSNNNEICEICHQKYSKSGNVLQPIWKWRKPRIEMTNLIELASVVCLSLCLWYMLALTRERQFIERVFYAGIPPRSPDIARIYALQWSFNSQSLQVDLHSDQELYECVAVVTLLIAATLAGGVMNIVTRVCRYINKQKAIHFIDSQANKKRSA